MALLPYFLHSSNEVLCGEQIPPPRVFSADAGVLEQVPEVVQFGPQLVRRHLRRLGNGSKMGVDSQEIFPVTTHIVGRLLREHVALTIQGVHKLVQVPQHLRPEFRMVRCVKAGVEPHNCR